MDKSLDPYCNFCSASYLSKEELLRSEMPGSLINPLMLKGCDTMITACRGQNFFLHGSANLLCFVQPCCKIQGIKIIESLIYEYDFWNTMKQRNNNGYILLEFFLMQIM